MSDISIAITGDRIDVVAAATIIAKAFIDMGVYNITSDILRDSTMHTIENFIPPDVDRLNNDNIKIIIK